ncbi:hypothetical protein Poli38472_002523 [Pythium oligandrum]|uniref:C2H2-type domain-containing protein n=1 Tax=Pythium oligandrum TaxID=41045 RepID=A0A8K1CJW5_PYTOL|nr:hypothetical protein Poli38472_002523 [Pythium oligandrum]|eukprot:TMW63582.1 hypothetical protein Poli38472_002523 [Pythium oligandrum]
MEHVTELPSGKCRRRYSPEHALFTPGNALRTTTYYRDAGCDVPSDDEMDASDEKPALFQCRLFNCDKGFDSIAAYEEHYDLVHRNICHACYRSFLSHRLMDIHISEMHDAFFRILSKRQSMYVCLVDGCTEVFKHEDKRMRHLVKEHKYPTSFSFHKPRRVIKPKPLKSTNASSTSDDQAKKKKRKPRKKPAKTLMTVSSDAMELCADEKTEAVEETTDSIATTDVDMVDELAHSMQQLRIPKNIAFGRRQRR